MKAKKLPTFAEIDAKAKVLVQITKFILPFLMVGMLAMFSGWHGVTNVGTLLFGVSSFVLVLVGSGFRQLLRLQEAKVDEFTRTYRNGDLIMTAYLGRK